MKPQSPWAPIASGCAEGQTADASSGSAPPRFARLGGEDAVQGWVDAFYRAMYARPDAALVRAMHEPRLQQTRALLIEFLCEWLGGPDRYTQRRGSPILRRRHHAFDIDGAARDAWLSCMRDALQEVCADVELRDSIHGDLSKMAELIRNTESEVDQLNAARPTRAEPP